MTPSKYPSPYQALLLVALLAVTLLACAKKRTAPDTEDKEKSGAAEGQPRARKAAAARPRASAQRPGDQTPPALPAENFAFSPVFSTKEGTLSAGKAVPVKSPGKSGEVLVVSCHHIFGPAGGLKRPVGGSELAAFIQEAALLDLAGARTPLGSVMPLTDAKPFQMPDASLDLSVFRTATDLSTRALELAPENPLEDETVWLLARLVGGAPKETLLHPARVMASDDKLLAYEFASARLELRATSGAPVVNQQGQLVGLNVGGGKARGKLTGLANPVSSIRKALARLSEAAP